MALRVWLPLNGSLENQGISGIVPTMMGSVSLTETGKIGKCAYFSNNPANCVYMDGLQQINNFSWTCWFKCVGEGSAAYQFLLSEGRDCVQYGVNLRLTKEGTGLFAEVGANSAVVRTSTKTVELNKWYHAAMTISNTELKLYVDGELFNTKTLTLVPNYEQSNNKFVIGKMAHGYTGTGSYFPFNGYVNDVRIYDHCLSPLEVKEISQGLVLHYKLDGWSGGVNQNLALDTANKTNTATAASHNVALDYGLQSNFNLIRGKKITISADIILEAAVSTNTSGSKRVGFEPAIKYSDNTIQYMGYWIGLDSTPKTLSGRYSTTVTVRDKDFQSIAQDGTYIQGLTSGTATIKNIKVELGDKATPWSPAPEDLGIDTTKITDSSGYGNDGIVTGSFTPESDSCRYDVSTKSLNGTDYIKSPLSLVDVQSFTCSFWVKPSSSNGGYSIVASNCNNPSSGFWISTNCESHALWFYNSAYADTAATSMSNDNWHHCVIVCNNKTFSMYIDGIQQTLNRTTSSSKTITINNLSIFNSYTGTSWNTKRYGNISDFRFYATALSAEDILDLYHTPANIDNLQNMHSFEFNEQLTQNVISDWTDVNLISMNGWSGSKSYNSNYNYLVLTATNGWRTFAWSTGGLTSQPCVFEFDYYLADNTNLSSTGIFIINRDTVEYGVPLMQLDTTLNKWNHCKFETNSALKYLGINIRGTDNTGNSVILYVRNVSINPSSTSGINRISKNGIFFNNAMYENGKILNTATSGTFTPTNINNSTTNYAVVDFREYSSLGKDLKVHIEADVEWTAFTGSGDGTFRGVWFQGANYQINSGSVWAGTNYICSALNSQYSLQNATILSTAGTYHYNTTTTIPASWFETYERSNFGMRCDYSDGTGTFKIKNFKVTVSEDSNARVTKDAILANSFIEK